jgi:hypothetical protein
MNTKLIYICIVLVVVSHLCDGKGIALKKQTTRYISAEENARMSSFRNKYSYGNAKVGNSVPLEGGFLDFGYYYLPVSIGTPEQTINVLVSRSNI